MNVVNKRCLDSSLCNNILKEEEGDFLEEGSYAVARQFETQKVVLIAESMEDITNAVARNSTELHRIVESAKDKLSIGKSIYIEKEHIERAMIDVKGE